jgi:hypothetical protein
MPPSSGTMRSMDPQFWAGVGVAAAVSTALATGVSTMAALWWRRQDRREADWAWFEASSQWVISDPYGNDRDPHAETTLANAGDGPAFRVEALGLGCTPWLYEERRSGDRSRRPHVPVIPVMQPGARMYLLVWCEPADWDAADVLISWTRSPTWKGHRNRIEFAIPLSDIAPRPVRSTRSTNAYTGSTETTPLPEPAGRVLPESLRPQLPPARGGRRSQPLRRRILRRPR